MAVSDQNEAELRSDHEPRPVEISPLMWVALGVVVLIGIRQYASEPSSGGFLNYLNPNQITVSRSEDAEHQFPRLGVQVAVSDGWTYLATSHDSQVFSPTFSHAKSNLILRLQPFHIEQWPPEGVQPDLVEVDGTEMLWVPVGRLLVGRWVSGEADLAVVVMGHQQKKGVPPEVIDFCRRVQVITEQASIFFKISSGPAMARLIAASQRG